MKNRTIMSKVLSCALLPGLAAALLSVAATPHALAFEEGGALPLEELGPLELPTVSPATAETSEAIATPEAEELAACQNVDLIVKNNHQGMIKVLRIEYKSIEDGKWRRESVANEIITRGQAEVVKSGANLEHIEGHRMEAMRVVYKRVCERKWTKAMTATKTTFKKKRCVYGRSFRIATSDSECPSS